MSEDKKPVIAILGGTGDLGTGLARRWAQAGYEVIIGSRTQDKAEAAAADLKKVMDERGVAAVQVKAMDNLSAAQAADIVAMTVPFSHQSSTLESVKEALQGKILIDVTVPLVPPKVARVQLPPRVLPARSPRNCWARMSASFPPSRMWRPITCKKARAWIATCWCVAIPRKPVLKSSSWWKRPACVVSTLAPSPTPRLSKP